MFFQNLSKYFQTNSDSSFFQLETVSPYDLFINNQIDFYYDENNISSLNSLLMKIFLFYFAISSIVILYIYKKNKKNKREIIRVENKCLILKNDKNTIRKKYNKILRMIERIKIISSKEDRSAKKMCLISSELQNRTNYKI